jgi:cupin 2 domain-containing protein
MARNLRKKIVVKNIFGIIEPGNKRKEIFETLFSSDKIIIEKITSSGQNYLDEGWMIQENDEWVILLQGKAELLFENNNIVKMSKGDYIFIPRKLKHKLKFTSKKPCCIWLAVHGKF